MRDEMGRTVLLTFGAVAHDATVFCNGRRVFHHGCGYTRQQLPLLRHRREELY